MFFWHFSIHRYFIDFYREIIWDASDHTHKLNRLKKNKQVKNKSDDGGYTI